MDLDDVIRKLRAEQEGALDVSALRGEHMPDWDEVEASLDAISDPEERSRVAHTLRTARNISNLGELVTRLIGRVALLEECLISVALRVGELEQGAGPENA